MWPGPSLPQVQECFFPDSVGSSMGSCQFLVLALLQTILVKSETKKHLIADVLEWSTQPLRDFHAQSQKQPKKWGDAGLDFQPGTERAWLVCLCHTKAQTLLMHIQTHEWKMQHKLLLRQLLGPEHSYLKNQKLNPRFLYPRSFYAVAGIRIPKIACLVFSNRLWKVKEHVE